MKKRFETLQIGDTFKVEYGAYENYTDAVIKDIKPTEYDHIKQVYYTIPHYTGEQVHSDRMLMNEEVII